jgi:hypothetical protein
MNQMDKLRYVNEKIFELEITNHNNTPTIRSYYRIQRMLMKKATIEIAKEIEELMDK